MELPCVLFLGHSQVQTTARYADLADAPVKAAADRIAGRIAEVAGRVFAVGASAAWRE